MRLNAPLAGAGAIVLAIAAVASAAPTAARAATSRPAVLSAPGQTKTPAQAEAPKRTLHIWASMGPGAYVAGATVTVSDRRGSVVARARTNRVGVAALALPSVTAARLPLRIQTSGGRENGNAFGGHLSTYVWPSAGGRTVANVDLITSAAVLTAPVKGKLTSREWRSAVARVRSSLGIGTDRAIDILRTRNRYVDYSRLKAAYRSTGPLTVRGYDLLAARIAAAARLGRPFRSLAAPRWSPQNPAIPTAAARGASAAESSDSPVCTASLPNSTSPGGVSTEQIEEIGIIGIGGLLEVAGVPATSAEGTAGMLMSLVGSGGPSPDEEALESVLDELDCISAQINALEVAANTQALATAMTGANACYSAIQTPWTDYTSLVSASQPVDVTGVTGAVGSTSIVLPGQSYANLYVGDAVSGNGIGVNAQTLPATGVTGDYSVTLTGTVTGVIPGLTVTGAGIGTNSDGTTATVQSVTQSNGTTVVFLSAANTGAVGGPVTFTAPAAIAGITYVGGNTVLTLTAVNTATLSPADTFSFAQLLNLQNADLMKDAPQWAALKSGSCGSAINDSLFKPAAPGVKSGWQQYAWNVLTNSGAMAESPFLTQAQVQSMQQFLSYWSSVLYQQFILTNESNNVYNLMVDAQGEAGAVSNGVDSFCVPGTTATSGTYCAYASNLAAAYPADLYSDEVAVVANGLAVAAIPAGMGGAFYTCSQPTGQMAMGTTWFTCMCPYAGSTPCTISGQYMTNMTYSALQEWYGYPLDTQGQPTAVETWLSPQVRHPRMPAAADVKAINATGSSGITGAQALLNGVNQEPTSQWSGLSASQVGFLAASPAASVTNTSANGWTVKFGTTVGAASWSGKTPGTTPVMGQLGARAWWLGITNATSFTPPAPIPQPVVGGPGAAGGTVFHIDTTQPEGSRYWEAAPAGWNGTGSDPSQAIGCQVSTLPPYSLKGPFGTAIGTGQSNTDAVWAQGQGACTAPFTASTYQGGGQNDWFLPSLEEFNALCSYATTSSSGTCTGGGSPLLGLASGMYWTSSRNQSDTLNAWMMSLTTGSASPNGNPLTAYQIRPIRSY